MIFKLVVKEHSRGRNPAEFWDSSTGEGGIVSWTKLMSRLREARKERDEKYAQAAKAKYGNLGAMSEFTYVKSGVRKTMASSQSIAKVYRKLEGLKDVGATVYFIYSLHPILTILLV